MSGVLASCAPHLARPPDLDATRRQARFFTLLAAREARGVSVEAELSLWVRSSRARGLPGAQARLLLGAPDAFRIRLESAFGTALDLAAHGDSLTAYVPGRHLGLSLGAAGDSLGLRGPGALGYRLWTAAWRPPVGAWDSVAWRDSALHVSWTEWGDSLELAVGSNGLPLALAFTPAGGSPLTVSYREWSSFEGMVLWPALLRLEEGDGDLTVTCRVHRARFARRVDPARLALSLPAEGERLTLARLKRALRGMGRL